MVRISAIMLDSFHDLLRLFISYVDECENVDELVKGKQGHLSKGSNPVKKNVFFRALPEMGEGEDPCPNFFTLFPPCFPLYFDISIMLFDTCWSFLTPKSSKVPKL